MRDQILAMRFDDNAELMSQPATLVAAPPQRLRVSSKRKSPLWRDHHWLYEWQECQKKTISETVVTWRNKAKVRDMFRKWYQRHKKAALKRSAWKTEWAELGQSQQRQEVQLAWTKLSEASKANWLVRGIIGNEPAWPSAHCTSDGRDDGIEGFGNRVLGLGDASGNYYGKAFLVTWNGEWGRNLDIWQRTTDVNVMKTQDFTTEVGSNPYYRGLFEKFKKCILRACTEVRATDVSMALERSMNSDNIWRVHFQVLLSTSSGSVDFKNGRWKLFEWDGVLPSHIVRCCHKRRGGSGIDIEGSAVTRGLFGRIEEGHYYFNYPKHGQLHQWSTLQKGVTLFPKTRWVGNAIHKRKMRLDSAENELWETRQPCNSLMQHVAKLKAREDEEEETRQKRIENEKIAAGLRPFVEAPEHIRDRIELWLKVSRGGCEKPTRSKPIVIDGPSQIGKSQWAAQWFGADDTLVVNCQDCVEPPLKHYSENKNKYRAIIFEEANWNLIYKNKMLFQSTNNYIDLGRSATNCHHYRVRMHCVPMFVLGNEFYQGIEQNSAARHYVERNIEFWAVTTTLFA